ncbi:hypothetical protein CDAR_165801 [Caerostris darwini]|uniref:Uncharacterized protein n=1 Tax=Caerostris darwini TaxID=1538125 RepID=A0AAV4RTZ5_9ARAC|nr:hypothetical protein CDAR_165801 [Caerostris darwini]
MEHLLVTIFSGSYLDDQYKGQEQREERKCSFSRFHSHALDSAVWNSEISVAFEKCDDPPVDVSSVVRLATNQKAKMCVTSKRRRFANGFALKRCNEREGLTIFVSL